MACSAEKIEHEMLQVQLLQALKPDDKVKWYEFCMQMQADMENDFATRLIFRDEATFYLSGKVNLHNVRVLGTENSHATVEHQRDSPKLNVFCTISRRKVYGSFSFVENKVTGISYLDMLTNWLFPHLDGDSDSYIHQQDGAPPHFHCEVRHFLNKNLPHRWIGRAVITDLSFHTWPTRSPDLTPCDFFLWEYVKDVVYVPPFPNDLQELRQRIIAAVATINRYMLENVWTEMDYRIGVCRVTRGSHIECLQGNISKL
jgi:hypothetical protein